MSDTIDYDKLPKIEKPIYTVNTYIEDSEYPETGLVGFNKEVYLFKVYYEWFDGYNYAVYNKANDIIAWFSLSCDDIYFKDK